MSNRGPKPYTSISSAVDFTPPILWIQIITAGSGGLVVVDDSGTTQTYSGLTDERVLVGPFRQITSMTCSLIHVGDSVPVPTPNPTTAIYASTSSGSGSDLI